MVNDTGRSNVVTFQQKAGRSNCLTARDREAIEDFRGKAKTAGYDRLLIHVTEPIDGHQGRDYVAAYRHGEAWATWGFARNGNHICTWNALTLRDDGTFGAMLEALAFVLLIEGNPAAGKKRPLNASSGSKLA